MGGHSGRDVANHNPHSQQAPGIRMRAGNVFTIHPMFISPPNTESIEESGYIWGTRSVNVSEGMALAAQWSHTVLVTKDGWELLALRKSEIQEDNLEARS